MGAHDQIVSNPTPWGAGIISAARAKGEPETMVDARMLQQQRRTL